MKDAPKIDQSNYNRWSSNFRDVMSILNVSIFTHDEKKKLLSRSL